MVSKTNLHLANVDKQPWVAYSAFNNKGKCANCGTFH
jgi:hypothetical protein